VAVREPGVDDRSERGSRLLRLDEALDRAPQWRVEGRSRTADALDPGELVVVLTERRADLGLGFGLRLARQQTAVADHRAERRDDVRLLGRLDDRRRDRVREHRLDHRAERLLEFGGVARTHEPEERIGLRQRPGLRLVLRQPLDEPRGPHECVVCDPRHGCVPAPAVHAKDERRAHLLCGPAQVGRAPVDHQPVAATLVDAVVGADRVRMVGAEPRETEVLADLFVGRGDEDHVSGGHEAVPRQRGDGDGRSRDVALHVEGSSSPDLPVAKLARPRVEGPLLGVGAHRVRVRDERECRAAAARNPRDEVRPLRHLGVELAFDSSVLEIHTEELGGERLVARRVDRVGA
jgi:hypothetical protein